MCSADARIYDSERLANCYAVDRPPVHAAICTRLFSLLTHGAPARNALDVGCGAGASAVALAPYASHITGVDPYPRMLRRARSVLPAATFLQGSAEALPVQSRGYDIVTAAGSLGYADVHAALGEVSRVLVPGGHFAPYDFSTGRVSVEGSRSDLCFNAFECAFPWPPGYSLDLSALPYREHGLMLLAHEEFLVDIEMSQAEYVRYVMSETNVEAAVSSGMSERDAWDLCWRTFAPLFSTGSSSVTFGAVLALARFE
jgi:ubiquinone/menaquinone biosynthesis C-methylase UbiE